MSQTLVLEVSDDVYSALRSHAEAVGTSPAQLAAASLEERFCDSDGLRKVHPLTTEAEKQAARERFERHFGEVDLGYPTGTDNESIDADLAREYANNHEED
jgi:hypothetical protein